MHGASGKTIFHNSEGYTMANAKSNVAQYPSSKLVVRFNHRNDTKGAHRYEEVDDGSGDVKIGSLYIRKTAMAGRQRPDSLTVTIE
jgi:hypothetical protein